MKIVFSTVSLALLALLALAHTTIGLNILMSNDDGFGASNLRELYRLLLDAGHNVYIVAPVVNNSGQGGRIVLDPSPTLARPAQYDLVPAGAPSLGQDPLDSHIWYYNGTPASCVLIGLDHVLPIYADFSVPDLFLSGPNFGHNLGPFVHMASGTLGTARTAIYRGIPSIAFSGGNAAASYQSVHDANDPATLVAREAMRVIHRVADKPVLPLGYGLNVNIPALNNSCTSPPLVQTSFSGHAGMIQTDLNATTGLVGVVGGSHSYVTAALNVCYHGDCDLPGESDAILACQTAVTAFTTDYDAPDNYETDKVVDMLFGGCSQ